MGARTRPAAAATRIAAESVVQAYVSNDGSGTVTPINTATNKPEKAIKVGKDPGEIGITPNGATAYVPNTGGDTVTPVTTTTNTPGAPISVGTQPETAAITPNGATA